MVASVAAGGEKALSRYLRREVGAHSPYYRRLVGDAGSGSWPGSLDDLSRLPLLRLADVEDPAEFVLRPGWRSVQQDDDRSAVPPPSWRQQSRSAEDPHRGARLAVQPPAGRRQHGATEGAATPARSTVPPRTGRRRRRSNSAAEHRYKPVHWTMDAGVPVGSSAADLERLAAMGAQWLALAGVAPTDVLVGLALPGPNLTFWQLVAGAREAGVSAVHLLPPPSASEVARLCPTVLAGRPFDLTRLLVTARAEGTPLTGVHTLLALGEPLEEGMRGKLLQLLEHPAGGAVVAAWAPPGVRALWSECRAGATGLGTSTAAPTGPAGMAAGPTGRGPATAATEPATFTVHSTPRPGLHTWPDAEVLEVIDPLSGTSAPPGADGEVVWTALGWSGTVFVRLRTGVFANIDTGRCPACQRTGPRLSIVSDTPAFLAALDRHPAVTGWQAELRTVGGREELLVFMSLAPAAAGRAVVRELDSQLSATQYVVVDGPTLDARLAAHDDRRVVDRRRR